MPPLRRAEHRLGLRQIAGTGQGVAQQVQADGVHGVAGRARAVADYIAGMTDRYAILEHRRLFEVGERI